MRLSTRKILDKAFSGAGVFSLLLMCGALGMILVPVILGGLEAFIFKGTIERRQYFLNERNRGDAEKIGKELAEAEEARQPVYEMIEAYEQELNREMKWGEERQRLKKLKKKIRKLLGPLPGEKDPVTPRQRYGDTRWDRAQVHLDELLYKTEYKFSGSKKMGKPVKVPRKKEFKGTPVEPLFGYMKKNLDAMLQPQWTFYWRFLTDNPENQSQYLFGGIWPSLLGTLYFGIGTILIAGPIGVISAIYLTEYAGQGRFISFLRMCISTLAGVPSIVFGLFGLIFFINSLHVSGDNASVFVGCLTLSLVVLPTVIRASEEAIRAVPHSYKAAALSLGASRWKTIVRVTLPAALPGIITSTIISMGRAAGETAPIMFTAAVAMGAPVSMTDIFSQPTPALSYNIYAMINSTTYLEEVRHVQYGMALTLIALVLLLNLTGIILRARLSSKLRN